MHKVQGSNHLISKHHQTLNWTAGAPLPRSHCRQSAARRGCWPLCQRILQHGHGTNVSTGDDCRIAASARPTVCAGMLVGTLRSRLSNAHAQYRTHVNQLLDLRGVGGLRVRNGRHATTKAAHSRHAAAHHAHHGCKVWHACGLGTRLPASCTCGCNSCISGRS